MMKASLSLNDFGDILTPTDIQRVLRIGRNATYELIASGRLPSIRVYAAPHHRNEAVARSIPGPSGEYAARRDPVGGISLGYLRKLGDKKFRIMYDVLSVNGTRRQKTETLIGVTKKQAVAILAKRKAAVVAGEFTPCADMTMNELFDRFMQAKEGRLAATTLQRYESLLRLYLRPAVGAKKSAA